MLTLDPLTHWMRPGIEPASSWKPIRFFICWARWNLPKILFGYGLFNFHFCNFYCIQFCLVFFGLFMDTLFNIWRFIGQGANQSYSHSNTRSELLCDLHHSSSQRSILNPLREARDQARILTDAGQICFCWATMGTPNFFFFLRLCCGIWKFLDRGQIRAAAAALFHSHSKAGSEVCLTPTPQLTAVTETKPTKRCQRSNPCLHGH